MQWLWQKRYVVLLATLVMLFITFPLLQTGAVGRVVMDALTTLYFVSGILAIFSETRIRWLAVVLGVPTLLANWSSFTVPGLPYVPVAAILHSLSGLFLIFVVVVLLNATFHEPRVTANTVCGAFCGYLLVGLIFGHIYCAVELLTPGSFRGDNPGVVGFLDEDTRRSLLTYMSFVTLTSVGFGDITPISGTARWLSVVEAIVGQFYIAILVADLVGKRVAHALAEPRTQSTQ